MLRPSMQTLGHIVVNVVDYGDDSLLGIPSEFEDMRTENIIETLTIRILVRRYANSGLLGDELARLDENTHISGVVFTEACFTGYRDPS